MFSRVSARLPRPAIVAAALVAGAGLLTVPAAAFQNSAAQAAPSATRLAGFDTASGAVRVGGTLWDDATVLPRSARTVTVQYRRKGSRFANASTVHSSASGAVRLGLRPPSAGTWQFRVVVKSTSRATRFVSKTRTVSASGRAARTRLTGLATSPTTVPLGGVVSDDVAVAPRGARAVLVQGRAPGAARFVTMSTGRATSYGAFHAMYRPTSVGAWKFRLVIPATATARSLTSPARTITAKASTAGTTTGGGTPTTGPTTGGTPAGGTAPGGTTPGDGGGTPGGGGSTPGDGGGTPLPATTTASLAVRIPGYPNVDPLTTVTVGEQFAFDASASVAADGGTLVSGVVDYGDGQSDPFTDTNGPVDYWNTLHTYTSTGTYTVTLSVTDADGTTDTTSESIDVVNPPTE